MKSYKDLDVYKIGLDLLYIVHPSTLKLPKHELYELGSQIRRSSDSVFQILWRDMEGEDIKLIL